MLYPYIFTASGLAQWFADDVNVNEDHIFNFIWEEEDHKAKMAAHRTNSYVKFEWLPKNEEDEEEYGFLTDLMKKEVDRINKIITDFLDFAKPFEPQKTMFSIEAFMEENIALFIAQAEEKGVKVETQIVAKDKQFFGDREKLTQVLINLLNNALEASEPNSSITIKSSFTRDKKWQLDIRDRGKGINKNNLNHIFDMYYTTKKNGTGLGLSIVHSILEHYDSWLDVESIPGKGTTFTLRFRCSPAT